MTVTKSQLIDSIHNKLHTPKTKSARLVDSLLEIIKAALEGGEDVLINGFGKFCVKENNMRRGQKPLTYEADPEALRIIAFKCSSAMRDMINGNGNGNGKRAKSDLRLAKVPEAVI